MSVQQLRQRSSWCNPRPCSTFIIPSLLHECSDVSVRGARDVMLFMKGICSNATWQDGFSYYPRLELVAVLWFFCLLFFLKRKKKHELYLVLRYNSGVMSDDS